jgi:type II secretory pathway component GspD/PulD (secretin)
MQSLRAKQIDVIAIRVTVAYLVALGCASRLISEAIAQVVVTESVSGEVKEGKVEQGPGMRGRHGGPPPSAPEGQPSPEAKPEDKDKKKEGEDAEKKKKEEEESKTVKRPEKPPRVPDPNEFKIVVDDKGRVPPFNFIGQPWPDVMQWLATNSKCSLDWQELPNDYLNLTTQRSYTLDEVHDLINRHLAARGFTSVKSGEVLSVFKIDKIDPSLVRRVTEDQLYDLKPYEFVKVSFELPAAMEFEKAKDEVKQLLNPAAKVFPLVASKRLLVMDSVANLRTVSELFNQERMIADGRIVPREFVLKHARPDKVIDILYVVLGMDPKSRPTQMDLQLQQQKLQLMMQMQQKGTDVSKMLKQEGPPVYLAYNRQRNSVLANAPPELMKIIEQTISYLDVPFGTEGGTSSTTTGAIGDNQRIMKKYPLTTLDPENFVMTLEEIGGLSPSAEFKFDKDSKLLFALATDSDHKKISNLIQDFDGSGRRFKVIQLRRLPADAVAATIYKLMAGQNDKDKDKDRRRYWDWYDNGRDEKKKDTVQGFGVDADIENNRLLLWANDAELERVSGLLTELGEIPNGQPDTRKVRFIEPTGGKPTAELLDRLREAWSATGGELIIKPAPQAKPEPSKEKNKQQKSDAEKSAKPAADRSADGIVTPRLAARFAHLDSAPSPTPKSDLATGAADTAPQTIQRSDSAETLVPSKAKAEAIRQPSATESKPAPVTVTVTEDGRLMLSSPDPAALDRMEQLIDQVSPPERRFKVYALKHIRAFDMYWDLKDYFKDDLETKETNNDSYPWYWDYRPRSTEDKGGPSLSKRRKLMITYDPPSNSILVANASVSQLAEIEQLIAEFDKPTRSDSVEMRQTAPIKIKYSRPSKIAATIKEVYRDLLSSRDKEFDRGDKRGDQKGGSVERVTEIFYHGSTSNDESRASPVKLGFDGALSLGADDVSGVLVVSAQKAIFNDIVLMVQELDEQAAPKTTVQVHHVSGNVSAEALQKALDKAVGKAWLGNRPEEQPNQTGTQGEKKRGDGEADRGEQKQNGEKKE